MRKPEKWQWIMCHALAMNLEVQMIGGGMSGTPNGADERSRSHAISRLDEVDAVMRVDGAQPVRVDHLDDAPVGALTPAERHGTACGGVNGRTVVSFDVHAPVPTPEPARAKARSDGPVNGPEEGGLVGFTGRGERNLPRHDQHHKRGIQLPDDSARRAAVSRCMP